MTARFNEGDVVAEDQRNRVGKVFLVYGPEPVLYTIMLTDGQRGQTWERHLRPATPQERTEYETQSAAEGARQEKTLRACRQYRLGYVPRN